MKNSFLFLLALLTFSFSNCSKNDLLPDDEISDEWEEYCEDLSGGSININVDGKDWSSNCVHAVYSENITADYQQKILYVYAYNHGITYFADSEIEVAIVYWIESTIDGQTTTYKFAGFYNGFYDYEKAISDPNYEIEDFSSYASDEDSTDNEFNITELNSNTAKGNFEFEVFEEDSNEKISMSGSFNANITE